MADPYHHSLSSVRQWGGTVDDYLPIHAWFDGSKAFMCDMRHRALRHHSEGIALAVQLFGPTITTSEGRSVPTRWVGEQHVREDLGRIPSVVDWLREITPRPWMSPKSQPIVTSKVTPADLVGYMPDAQDTKTTSQERP